MLQEKFRHKCKKFSGSGVKKKNIASYVVRLQYFVGPLFFRDFFFLNLHMYFLNMKKCYRIIHIFFLH